MKENATIKIEISSSDGICSGKTYAANLIEEKLQKEGYSTEYKECGRLIRKSSGKNRRTAIISVVQQ